MQTLATLVLALPLTTQDTGFDPSRLPAPATDADFHADGAQPAEKVELARSFILRRMLMVEMNARRISTGDASRIKRYDQILGL